MALSDYDGATATSFGLEVQGITIKSITEVTGLKIKQDVIQLKENGPDGKYVIRMCPGKWKPAEVALIRAKTQDQSFEQWMQDSQLGKMSNARKSAAVIIYDYEGQVVTRYNLQNAWVKSLEIGSLAAGSTSVLTEKLVLTVERIEVE